MKTIFILISIFLLSIFCSIDPKSPLFVNNGDCPQYEKEYFCNQFKALTFSNIFNTDYDSKIQFQDEVNFWIEQNPFYKKKIQLKYDNNSDSFKAYSREDINQYQSIYFMNDMDTLEFKRNDITYSLLDKNSTRIQEHIKLTTPNFKYEENQFIFITLYNLYWNKLSQFYTFFKFLPKIPKSGLFLFTDYEINLLKGDHAYYIYKLNYDKMRKLYESFMKDLKETWSEDQIESVLKFAEIPIEDFAYAYYILVSFSYTNEQNQHVIPFGLAIIPRKHQNDSSIGVYRFPNQQVGYRAERDIDINEELYFEYKGQNIDSVDLNSEYLIQNLEVPENNKKDCVFTFMMDEDIAKKYEFSGTTCLSLNNQRLLKYHAIGNLLNMNKNEKEACDIIKKREISKIETNEHEKLFVFHNCAHPQWKKINIWDTPIGELQQKKKNYQKNIKKTREYIQLRKENQLSTYNGEKILKYLKLKLKTVEELLINIDRLELDSKSFITHDDLQLDIQFVFFIYGKHKDSRENKLSSQIYKQIIGLGNPTSVYSKTRHNIGKSFIEWYVQKEQLIKNRFLGKLHEKEEIYIFKNKEKFLMLL